VREWSESEGGDVEYRSCVVPVDVRTVCTMLTLQSSVCLWDMVGFGYKEFLDKRRNIWHSLLTMK
jgi:hypothetical protein